MLLIVIQGVAPDVIFDLAAKQPPEIVKGHPQAVKRCAGTGDLKQIFNCLTHRIDGTDAYRIANVVLAAPGKRGSCRRINVSNLKVIDIPGAHSYGFLHAPRRAAISESAQITAICSGAKRRQALLLTYFLQLEHPVERFTARLAAIRMRRIELAPQRIDLIRLATIV